MCKTGLVFNSHEKGSILGGIVCVDLTDTESVATFGKSMMLVVTQRTLGGCICHEGCDEMTI